MKLVTSLIFLGISAFLSAQQTAYIDFKKGEVDVNVDLQAKEISGSVTYTFEVLKETDSVLIDAQKMNIQTVFLNEKEIDFQYDDAALKIYKKFKSNKSNSLKIVYSVKPTKAFYFTQLPDGDLQAWTQGQGKYTSHWLPSFDDMNEKVEFDITVTAPSLYKVMANGKLADKTYQENFTTWKFDMQAPMSSYLVAMAIGKYSKKDEKSKSGIPLELYYYPTDVHLAEPTYRHTKRIFDFLEEEIGVPYPWQNYKQVPVKDFLYAGMENTSLTIFSDSFLVDSIGFVDKNYINVNAHELAHQWFGDLVTEENSTHHWLQEGFATYFALLAERDIFGDSYFYEQLYKTAKQLEKVTEEGGESLLNPNASSLTFYQRGAWALFALHELIGDRAFDKSVKKYLKDYAYKNANTHDFINIASAKSQTKLEDFVQTWFVNEAFPIAEAEKLLQENNLSKSLLELEKMDKESLLAYANNNPTIFDTQANTPLASFILDRLSTSSEEEMAIFLKALNSKVLNTRQAAAIYAASVPQSIKPSFEALLKDKSYITIENALMKLWTSFPSERNNYLEATKGIEGFQDKNVETLWLTLALITEGYAPNKKMDYYNTLVVYTDAKQHFEVRQQAFQYLYQIQALNEVALKNLLQACKHPVWQFSKFSRQLLDELLKSDDYKMMLKGILNGLSVDEQAFLNEKLTE
ncbi:M1 family metallopeptidase [Galbibacter sp. BG1]|uniref:M1 family metallopeptidase n=1 Tax=Galbibacter sp. BG1 TaxID=1170699 RepID=UPI0015BACC04|nr:M1 family metallopeptidase [Galbibacter sp. BG1]QLE02923.1 M1 family metallopeptidase [Galbibacter sp. BG1]